MVLIFVMMNKLPSEKCNSFTWFGYKYLSSNFIKFVNNVLVDNNDNNCL